MAVVLGKRKRRADGEKTGKKHMRSEREDSADEETAKTLFQRAFEAKFKPLEKTTKPIEDSDDEVSDDVVDDEQESDWGGLSDGEDDEVEVVEHAVPDSQLMDDIFDSKKSFMSSKPPRSEDGDKASRKTSKTPAAAAEEDSTETANLKNDLDLQRLLKESHLLDPSSFRTSSTPQGKSRLKALDMRLQSLGAKTSVLQQEKMPLAHRKGIASKNASREALRRKEAAENGVILEKAQNMAKSHKKRDRGIGGPGVGKFRAGTLKLSSRDVASIQGSGSRRRGKKGGK